MIGSLEGILEHKGNGDLLINVHGIGYEVGFPKNTERLLPDLGSTIKVFTYMHVTENSHALYGFLTLRQKEIFLHLLSVSGIGPKTALTILSDVEPDTLIQAISAGDAAFLSSLHGIGKKTAERLVIELKDKIRELLPEGGTAGASDNIASLSVPHDVVQDVTQALSSLGYSPREIKQALSKLSNVNKGSSAEEIIRAVLKYL